MPLYVTGGAGLTNPISEYVFESPGEGTIGGSTLTVEQNVSSVAGTGSEVVNLIDCPRSDDVVSIFYCLFENGVTLETGGTPAGDARPLLLPVSSLPLASNQVAMFLDIGDALKLIAAA